MSLNEMTVAQFGRSMTRYSPFIATIAAVLLIVVVLPSTRDDDEAPQRVTAGPTATTTAGGGTGGGAVVPQAGATTTTAPPAGGSAPSGGTGVSSGSSGGSVGGGGGGTGTSSGGTTSGGEPAGGGTDAGTGASAEGSGETSAPTGTTPSAPLTEQQAADPNCDTALGRVKVPMVYSVPCRSFDGQNTGDDYQGVTGNEIVVAVYRGQGDPALSAILAAAGADDSREQIEATVRAYVDLFQKHYQTYGRTVKLVYVEGSGPASDDSAGKADAIRVATEIKAFISVSSPNNAYVDELTARGVMCICTTQLPQKHYDRWGGLVWSTLMSYDMGILTVDDHIEKQLAGYKAKWAGDALYQQMERRFGLICYDDSAQNYKEGCDNAEIDMAERGINRVVTVRFTFDLAQAQEQSRTMIARLKEAQATTLFLALDPIYPIFLTQEATRQNYFPEWQIVGGALTDTTFFGRTYAKEQWAHAFGESPLTARGPQEVGNAYRLHVWHHGRPPDADDSYGVIFPGPFLLFTMIHMAGETLTPQTVYDGMKQFPPSGGGHTGGVTNIGFSFGNSIGLWPAEWQDTLAADDYTLVWWDQTAQCKDEIGNDGVGCLRYIDGGKRYFAGQWPVEEMRAFDPAGTVVVYDELPPSDAYPEYEHQPH